MKSTQINRVYEVAAQKQLCIHALTGRAPRIKMCAGCYDCAHCEYDQMLEDTAHVCHGENRVAELATKAA
jgi:hypothetical protein